jgi:hypothetical protein
VVVVTGSGGRFVSVRSEFEKSESEKRFSQGQGLRRRRCLHLQAECRQHRERDERILPVVTPRESHINPIGAHERLLNRKTRTCRDQNLTRPFFKSPSKQPHLHGPEQRGSWQGPPQRISCTRMTATTPASTINSIITETEREHEPWSVDSTDCPI